MGILIKALKAIKKSSFTKKEKQKLIVKIIIEFILNLPKTLISYLLIGIGKIINGISYVFFGIFQGIQIIGTVFEEIGKKIDDSQDLVVTTKEERKKIFKEFQNRG